ncbi:MAG: CoA transferase [Acidobacteria bacterium]|nr:CoA transferase [Acidobacteriota bacterium]
MNKDTPLKGLRIVEMGQLLAGPFASVLLAWFGAEVIKIEPPEIGDPLRTWRKVYNGTALWWYILGRNKKCVTLNLRDPRGQAIARSLIKDADALLENFKPGTLEKWGLGYDALKSVNPELIMVRVSGWGQNGPYGPKPGYASVAEGVGGLRFLTGFPDRPPARPNLSLGDSLAGLHAALGLLMAVYHRDVHKTKEGQVVDVAIYEAVFNMMESLVPEYDLFGLVRERQGCTLTGIVPTNTYPCQDGKYIIIGGNGDSIFKRLMVAAGRADMAEDPRYAHNNDRVEHEREIDQAISEWTETRAYSEILEALEKAGVPAGPIYSIADIMKDPHYQERGMFETAELPDGTRVKLPTFAPKLTETPGRTEWIGPRLGEHNEEVYCGQLGMSTAQLEELKAAGVI